MKIKIDKVLKNTWNDCKLNLKKVILFEMIYKLLVFIVFTPLIFFVLKVSVNGMGYFNLTNNELINLGLKIPGIIGIILITVLAFIVTFIEIGVLTHIADMSHKNKIASVTQGIIKTTKILPNIIGIYILQILFICIIMGPISGLGLGGSLLKKLSIPLFIKVELFRTDLGKVFLISTIVLGVIISLRWILFLPITMIEKVSLKEALKKSKAIYKKRKFSIVKYLVLWIIVNLVIRILPLGIYIATGGFILTGEFSAKAYLLIFIIAYTLTSIVTLPFFVMFLVEVYYACRDYEVDDTALDNDYNLKSNRIYLFMNSNKRILITLTTILFSVMIFYTSFNSIYTSNKVHNVSVTAHRGYNSLAPENSMPAINYAVEYVADYVEIDVMTTKDNKIVVFHDSSTKRFDKNNRKIKDMTLEEVKNVDIGLAFDMKSDLSVHLYQGEKVPTLEEVFKEFKGKIKFNIELKPNGKNDTLEKEVAKLIKQYDMEKYVVISSLDYNSIEKFKNENVDVKEGYILTFGIGDFTKLDVDFISIEYGMLSKELVDTMHRLGKEVHVWTLNKEEEIINAASLGVDNIITDNVWGTTMILVGTNHKTYNGFENTDLHYSIWLNNNIRYILKYVNI